MNLQHLVQSLEVGPAAGAANLTMFPLLLGDDTPAEYATLDCHAASRRFSHTPVGATALHSAQAK